MVATLSQNLAQTLRLVRLGIGREEFAVPLDAVETILRLEPGRWNDNHEVGSVVRGSLTFQKEELGVLCLASLLGRRTYKLQNPFALILNSVNGRFALLVERVSPSTDHRLEAMLDPPESVCVSTHDLVTKLIREDGGFLMLLAPERLVEERQAEPDVPSVLKKRSQTTTKASQLIVFRTQEFAAQKRPIAYGVPANWVLEVADLPPVQKLPTTSADLLGVVPWRQFALPIVDLSARIGLGAGSSRATRAVVIRHGKQLLGLAALPGVHVVNLPIPHADCACDFASPLVRGAIELKHETLIAPDVAALFE
jgi:chemotaxis signal transduction protein